MVESEIQGKIRLEGAEMVDSLEGDPIWGLLKNKIHFLEELLTCSKMLSQLTYENHQNEYDSLLETRERCIETLNSIGAALQSELESRGRAQNTGVLEDNGAYASLNTQAKMLVQEILVLDEQNKAAISTELQNLKMRIQALHFGRRGINGYNSGQQMSPAGIFTDSRK